MKATHPRHARSTIRRNRRAVTLVELLIVVVVVAIATTLVVPMMGATDGSRVQAAARLLFADLAYAQFESISHADDLCVVTFDQANNSYMLARASAPATPITDPTTGQPYVTQFGSGRAAAMSGVTIDSYLLGGDNQLEFNMYGGTDQAGAAKITLLAGTATLTVRVNRDSGETALVTGSGGVIGGGAGATSLPW
ncbi:MAG: prepilin-type N-terminal cleavage/methylation domain-containing protein [bacterium]|nr:prepilin-type N-terminal cleavage/methylation domain-containing protein [bacterium]